MGLTNPKMEAVFIVLLEVVAFYHLFSTAPSSSDSHIWLGVYCMLSFLTLGGVGLYWLWRRYGYGEPTIEYSVLRSTAYIDDNPPTTHRRCRPPSITWLIGRERAVIRVLCHCAIIVAVIGICFGFIDEDYFTVSIASGVAFLTIHIIIGN